ncbi:hypothetical protein F2Q69_00037201 [Brassica cretica]|uniref:Uncharacterized protein n=1 Tax=Brassica cretica TaxID=69181 RepID=A0A8S9SJB2_BRACR|nr:hypothetical protein F2Q69_00037201 [Brassica cretica]
MDSTSCHNEKVSFENNKNSVIGKGKLLSLRFQERNVGCEVEVSKQDVTERGDEVGDDGKRTA